MDEPRGYHAERVSQTENDKYPMISFVCVNLRNKIRKQTKQNKHRYREQTVGHHMGGGWRMGFQL